MPLQKQELCTKKKINRWICIVFLISCVISLYKPILHYFYPFTCEETQNSDNHRSISVRLDFMYASLVTIIPCLVILVLNILIGRTLIVRSHAFSRIGNGHTGHRSFSHQYGVILVVISLCYLILNLPYTINWLLLATDRKCSQKSAFLTQIFYITKTVFYLNYCANFFLYNLTLSTFRRCLIHSIFRCKEDQSNHAPIRIVTFKQ